MTPPPPHADDTAELSREGAAPAPRTVPRRRGPDLVDRAVRGRMPALLHDAESEGVRMVLLPPGRIDLSFELEPSIVHVSLNAVMHAWMLDTDDWTERHIPADSIAFAPQGSAWAIRTETMLPSLMIEIDGDRIPAILRDVGGDACALSPIQYEYDPVAGELARAGINLLMSGIRTDAHADRCALRAIALGLVARVARRSIEERPLPPDDALPSARARDRMQVVVDHVERHLHRLVPVGEMADLVGMSLTTFNDTFRLAMNVSPARYVLVRRIAQARTMLSTTDEPITQIAFACGFFDQSHLTRTFKGLTGTTPREYRRRLRHAAIARR